MHSYDATTEKPSTRAPARSPAPAPAPTPAPSPTVSDGRDASQQPDTAQTLLAEHVDSCRARPPGNVLPQLGKHVAAMLAEGTDPAAIRAGLARFREKPMHPSVLPSLVNEILNAPAPQRKQRPVGAFER